MGGLADQWVGVAEAAVAIQGAMEVATGVIPEDTIEDIPADTIQGQV